MDNNLIEILSDLEHKRWSKWQKYVHSICVKNKDGSLTIPKIYVDRWERQFNTDYLDLTEKEKESDRKEAHFFLNCYNSQEGLNGN